MNPEISHINQIRCKIVRIHDDIVERFSNDPRWSYYNQFERAATIDLFSQISGREVQVMAAWRTIRNVQMYRIFLPQPVLAMQPAGHRDWIDITTLCSDYTTIIDSGFMEAR